jgi:hypothetical protein
MPVPEVKLVGTSCYTDKVSWSNLVEADETGETLTANIGTISIKTSGDYYLLSGIINANYMSDDSEIYIGFVTADGEVTYYDTFWISQSVDDEVDDNGFAAYFLKSDIPDDVVLVKVVVI